MIHKHIKRMKSRRKPTMISKLARGLISALAFSSIGFIFALYILR